MENLEEKIQNNKILLSTKFIKVGDNEEIKDKRVKFTGNWDNGWGNRVMKLKNIEKEKNK